MATGSYSCESNWVDIQDIDKVRNIFDKYNTNNQTSIDDGRIKIESTSDSINIYNENNGEIEFLRELSKNLDDKIVVKNIIRQPRGDLEVYIIEAESGEVKTKKY